MTRIVGTKFQLELTILIFFDQICSKREFPVKNGKTALVHASMVVTYYIKLFRTRADRHNGILMSLLLLDAETKIKPKNFFRIRIFLETEIKKQKTKQHFLENIS